MKKGVAIAVVIMFLLCVAALLEIVTGDWDWEEESPEAVLRDEYFDLVTVRPISVTVTASDRENEIWDKLYAQLGNPYGVAGIMGNLWFESNFYPGCVYSGFLQSKGWPDSGYNSSTYLQEVMSGAQDFAGDGVPFGIAQWLGGHKSALLAKAAAYGVSVADLGMQVDYLLESMSASGYTRYFHQEFGYEDLTFKEFYESTSSIREASDVWCLIYEAPGPGTEDGRFEAAKQIFQRQMLRQSERSSATEAQLRVVEVATNSADYGIEAEAGYCQRWAAYVYSAAGLPLDNSASAAQSAQRYGVSDNWDSIPLGAAVYGHSSSQYGHVGIYVGGGKVYHNVGGVAVDSLADWIAKYDGFCWGWEAGADLTDDP